MRKIRILSFLFLMVFLVGFIADIFFFIPAQSYTEWGSDIRLFVLLIFWLFIGKIFRFTSFTTFKLVLLYVITFSILFVFFREISAIERLSSWIYIYLATGVIQQFFEAKSPLKGKSVN